MKKYLMTLKWKDSEAESKYTVDDNEVKIKESLESLLWYPLIKKIVWRKIDAK